MLCAAKILSMPVITRPIHYIMDFIEMRSVTSQSFIDKVCICLHCIDLSATEEVVIESFPCLKVKIGLGHITFPEKMAETNLCFPI